MKNTFALLLLFLFAGRAGAQKIVEKQVNLPANATVTLNIQIADSIRIITWNKNTAYVKTSININDNKDNEEYKVNFDNSSDRFEMNTKLEPAKGKCDNCNCNYKAAVYCEVYVPENTRLNVETINGNITITGNTATVHAKSISGFVDVAIPPQRKADIKLSTITGTMYSDLDLNAPDEKPRRVGGNKIAKTLNGGGEPVELQTISGDIYLRKG
jgi:DUF4097 and DUF4098 domain-containing protein YvlB